MNYREWKRTFEESGVPIYVAASGHLWLRFRRWAFMRYPLNDLSPVTSDEARELFFSARALVISHYHEPTENEHPNSLLYLCREPGYSIDSLSSNNRSKVRRGLKRFDVRRTTREEIAEKGYRCYSDKCTRNELQPLTRDLYIDRVTSVANSPSIEMWAAFSGDEIAAYGEVRICGRLGELMSTASASSYLRDYPNHALFFTILSSLMQRGNIESVSYGLSSIQRESNMDSLDYFKTSIGFEAIPVVRRLEVNPLLRPLVNPASQSLIRVLESWRPGSLFIRTARGALDMISGDGDTLLPGKDRDTVSPFESKDAEGVAKLYRKVFPQYIASKLGQRFCCALCGAYADHPEAFGFVARRGRETIGFVFGGPLPMQDEINQSLRKRAAFAMMLRPTSMLSRRIWGKIRQLWRQRSTRTVEAAASDSVRPAENEFDDSAKLVLIGVAETERGRGVAQELLSAFQGEAARRGFGRTILIVEQDNAQARAAYEKAGWTVEEDGSSLCYVRHL